MGFISRRCGRVVKCVVFCESVREYRLILIDDCINKVLIIDKMVEVVEYWVKGIVEGYVFEVDIGSNCVVIEEESSIIGNVEYVIFK